MDWRWIIFIREIDVKIQNKEGKMQGDYLGYKLLVTGLQFPVIIKLVPENREPATCKFTAANFLPFQLLLIAKWLLRGFLI